MIGDESEGGNCDVFHTVRLSDMPLCYTAFRFRNKNLFDVHVTSIYADESIFRFSSI